MKKNKSTENIDLRTRLKKSAYLSVWELLILAIFVAVVSMIMLFVEGMMETYFIYIGGLALLAVGIWQIVVYFKKDHYKDLSSYGFTLGVVLVLVGVCVLLRADDLVVYAPILMGVLVLLMGVIELQHAIQLRAIRMKYWFINLAISLFSLVFSMIVLMGLAKPEGDGLKPFYGLVFASSILGVIAMGLVLYFMKKYQKEGMYIEVETAEAQEIIAPERIEPAAESAEEEAPVTIGEQNEEQN